MDDTDLAEIRDRLSSIEEMVGDLCVALGATPRTSAPTVAARSVAPAPVTATPAAAAAAPTPVEPAAVPVPALTATPRPESAHRPSPPPTATVPPMKPAAARSGEPTTPATGPTRTTEELLGGRGLAIVGGLAVLIGIVFFVAVAIRNGMLPPSLRMILAAIGSAALVVGAERVHRRGLDSTLSGVLAVVGLLGGFATMLGSINHFDLIPHQSSLVIAPLIGAAALWCGHRCGLRFLIALGAILAIVGPIASQIDPSPALSVYTFGVFVLAGALALHFGWQELWPLGAIGVAITWAPWFSREWYTYDTAAVGIAALCLVLVANVAIAVASDGRWSTTSTPTPLAIAVLPAATAGVALGGVELFHTVHAGEHAQNWWITGLAVAMSAGGYVVAMRNRARLTGPFVVAIGFALAAVAIGMWFEGPGRAIGWAAQAVVAAWAARAVRDDRPLLGSVLALAIATIGAVDRCPPRSLGWDEVSWQGVVAVAAVAIAAAAAAWLSRELPERFIDVTGHRTHVLVALSALATWYGGSVAIVQALGVDRDSTQVVLSVVWAIIGLGLIVAGLSRHLRIVRIVGLGLLGLALAKLVLFDLRYLESTSRALSFIMVGLLALAGAYAYQRVLAQIRPSAPARDDAPPDADADNADPT